MTLWLDYHVWVVSVLGKLRSLPGCVACSSVERTQIGQATTGSCVDGGSRLRLCVYKQVTSATPSKILEFITSPINCTSGLASWFHWNCTVFWRLVRCHLTINDSLATLRGALATTAIEGTNMLTRFQIKSLKSPKRRPSDCT